MQRRYQLAHPDAGVRAQCARRTRKTKAGGSFTASEWRMLLELFGHTCPACRQRKPLEPDHIIPVKMGGPSWAWNIQPLCKSCNARKGPRQIIAYAPRATVDR